MSFTLKSTPVDYRPYPYSTEERKKELLPLLHRYRHQVKNQWDDVKDDTLRYGMQALIIGGVVVGVYLAMNALLTEEEEENNKETVSDENTTHRANEESKTSIMGSAIKSMVLALALRWARKKLTNFL